MLSRSSHPHPMKILIMMGKPENCLLRGEGLTVDAAKLLRTMRVRAIEI